MRALVAQGKPGIGVEREEKTKSEQQFYHEFLWHCTRPLRGRSV